MQQDGLELLAIWREVGEWWCDKPPHEYRRFIDDKGIRRELEHVLEEQYSAPRGESYDETHTEEWSLRLNKLRDEKVMRACGLVPKTSHRILEPQSGSYSALHVTSGYAFGRGTMLAEEIPVVAAACEIQAVALTDPFSLVGSVEFARMARSVGIKPLIGTSVEMPEGGELVLIARSKRGYRNLSNLITQCHLGEARLFPQCTWERLREFSADLFCLTGGDQGYFNHLVNHRLLEKAANYLDELTAVFGSDCVFVEVDRSFLPWEVQTNKRLIELAIAKRVTCVASGLVTHARPGHFPVQDTIVCIHTLCKIDELLGRKQRLDNNLGRPDRALNSERFLRSSWEMSNLFADSPALLANTNTLAGRCDDDVLPNRTRLPELHQDSRHVLRELTFAGAHYYHKQISAKLTTRLTLELNRICNLNFANHFLMIADACSWARENEILFSARGSVVDSAVAYCLGLSRVDAYTHHLHFDRFLPEDGSKRPDIDIDIEAKRRDDVRNYFIRKYGESNVATVAAIGSFRSKGIIREVGKVFGMPDEVISFLAKRLHGGVSPAQLEGAIDRRPELRNSNIPKERFRWVFELAERMMDIPRNMRAHSSGVVVSAEAISNTVPVMWGGSDSPNGEGTLKIIQWDKRSAKYYFDKFDLLCLRGQDVLGGTEARIRVNDPGFTVQSLPLDDIHTYEAMRSGDLIGIPQSASPAMRQAHIRLQTENLHDASLVQAGIRPGVGGAVKINELIARRRGKPYTFEHPELERILGITYGIIVFQEQVDQLLQAFCGFSSGEAEETREKIHERRREDYGQLIRDEITRRIIQNGFSHSVAETVFELVSGFKGYGFAQGHALAFAEISIRCIYCQQNFPAEYFASLLSAQPAGYYGSCTIANEARVRGIQILPPCVNKSDIAFSVEDIRSEMEPNLIIPNGGIRIGLMQILGISNDLKERIITINQMVNSRFNSFFDFVTKLMPTRDELEQLILSGSLDGLCTNRRAMLWAIPSAMQFARAKQASVGRLPFDFAEPSLDLSMGDFSNAEKAVLSRKLLDLDVEKHLLHFERERISSRGGIATSSAKQLRDGQKAIVVGNPIRLRFPPTQSGKRVVFFDLEDETGLLNVTCFDDTYQKYGHAIICSPYVTLIGGAQDRDGHMAFLAKHVFEYKPVLVDQLNEKTLPVVRADFLVG